MDITIIKDANKILFPFFHHHSSIFYQQGCCHNNALDHHNEDTLFKYQQVSTKFSLHFYMCKCNVIELAHAKL